MIATPHPATASPTGTVRAAVVWIDRRRAAIALLERGGALKRQDIVRGFESELEYLDRIVQAVDDRDRLLILGPDSTRSWLERIYVTRYPSVRHLVDVEPQRDLGSEDLVRQLHELAQ
jgi:hypothetical protein